jgi:hypothetical protein
MTRTRDEIMRDICDIYDRMSGERISHDGELSLSVINKKRKSLENKLNKLKIELNEDVSEYSAWTWWLENQL